LAVEEIVCRRSIVAMKIEWARYNGAYLYCASPEFIDDPISFVSKDDLPPDSPFLDFISKATVPTDEERLLEMPMQLPGDVQMYGYLLFARTEIGKLPACNKLDARI